MRGDVNGNNSSSVGDVNGNDSSSVGDVNGNNSSSVDIVSKELLNRKDEDNGSSWSGEGKVNGSSFPREDNGTFPREEDILVEEEHLDVVDIKTIPPGVHEKAAAHVGHVGEGTGLHAEEEKHGNTPMEVVREIAADNGNIVDSQVEDRAARNKVINDKNAD